MTDVRTADERTQLEVSLADYRRRLPVLLTGLDEEQARRRLVPSRTTILGLVKHLTFVENVWFNEVIIGTPRDELGPATPDRSFVLTKHDTIPSVVETHRLTYEASQRRAVPLDLDQVLIDRSGNPLTVRFLLLQRLREYAHHTGHADILREQILSG